jgi:hypothetical protein
MYARHGDGAHVSTSCPGRENTLLQPGDVAPDFELQTTEGQSVSLGGTLRDGRSVLLVFLRHLG